MSVPPHDPTINERLRHLEEDVKQQFLDGAAQFRAGTTRMDNMQQSIDTLSQSVKDNTSATNRVETSTKEMVEAFQNMKGALAVFNALGRAAKPLTYIVMLCSAVYALFTFTPPK
jgi:flagellar biosynthesis chaperone FliJ